MVKLLLSTTKILALGAIGFVLAWAGISAKTGKSPLGVNSNEVNQKVAQVIANSGSGHVAQACVSANERNDEIFFLSCGGIF